VKQTQNEVDLDNLIRIGELARRTGITVATLRYFESEELIECVRTRSRYRMFPKDTVKTIADILHLKSLHIPLKEIRAILLSRRQSQEQSSEKYAELKARLAHAMEQRRVWEQQETQVRVLLSYYGQEETPLPIKSEDRPSLQFYPEFRDLLQTGRPVFV